MASREVDVGSLEFTTDCRNRKVLNIKNKKVTLESPEFNLLYISLNGLMNILMLI